MSQYSLPPVQKSEFGKRSLSRNPLIFGLFEKIDIVEQIGSGVGRIRDLMEEAGLPVPIFMLYGMFWKDHLTENR